MSPLRLVQKARRTASSRAQASAYRVARRNLPSFRRAFETLADSLTGAIDKRALTAALEAGNLGAAVQALPEGLTERERRRLVATFDREYKAAVREAGAAEFKRLGLGMNFSLDNPYSVPWIEAHGAELVTRISSDTRETIRSIVAEGFRLGNPPREMARDVELSVGLLPRQALAASRYRQRLRDQGVAPARVATLDERYRTRLLRQRAEMIARTETIAAEAQGILDAWMDARDQGLIIPGTRKVWLAAPSDSTCEVCLGLGDLEPIELTDSWDADEGPISRPPAHPQCRCSMGLVLP